MEALSEASGYRAERRLLTDRDARPGRLTCTKKNRKPPLLSLGTVLSVAGLSSSRPRPPRWLLSPNCWTARARGTTTRSRAWWASCYEELPRRRARAAPPPRRQRHRQHDGRGPRGLRQARRAGGVARVRRPRALLPRRRARHARRDRGPRARPERRQARRPRARPLAGRDGHPRNEPGPDRRPRPRALRPQRHGAARRARPRGRARGRAPLLCRPHQRAGRRGARAVGRDRQAALDDGARLAHRSSPSRRRTARRRPEAWPEPPHPRSPVFRVSPDAFP